MATQYTPILQLALPVTGELNGTWGDVVNDNITSMVEEAIAGKASISTWTANSHTLTTANGTTDEARCAMLVAATGAGGTALTAAGEIICPARTKLFVLSNGSAYTVTLKTSAGTGVAVAAGETAFLFCDGTDVKSCVTQIVNGHITGNLTVDGNAQVNGNTTLGDVVGDTITVNGATTFVNANPTLSQGTANRVLFLNASKVVSDAAGLTWDGTTLSATKLAGALNGTVGATTPTTGVFTQVDITAQGDLRLQDTTGGEYVALQAPGTLASSYTLTLPVDDGTSGQALVTDGSGNLSWSTAASGDVYGPASSTDTAVALFDGTTGKLIKNSGVTIDGLNNVSGVAQLNATTADLTNIEVTNIKAKDGTAAISIADTTGVVTGSTPQIISVNSSSDALRITQTGSGNALLVEDSANPDATPTVIDTNGRVVIGNTASISTGIGTGQLQVNGTSASTSMSAIQQFSADSAGPNVVLVKSRGALGAFDIVNSGDTLGNVFFLGSDGTTSIRGAQIKAEVDGTPGTNDMPGRLVFSTTADGASSPTERMRIDSAGQIGIGGVAAGGRKVDITGTLPAASGFSIPYNLRGTIPSGATTAVYGFYSTPTTEATAFTLPTLTHFFANPAAFGAGSTVTNQYGFHAGTTLTGATNNYGFYGNIASGTGRYNFYAAGSAANYFAGTLLVGSTVNTNDYKVDIAPDASGAALRIRAGSGGTGAIQFTDNTLSTQYGTIAAASASLNITHSSIIRFDTASTERMRITSAGNIGVGTTPAAYTSFYVSKAMTGGVNTYGVLSDGQVQSDSTSSATYFWTGVRQAAGFTLSTLNHYSATQGTISGTVTNQYGFSVGSSLTGATNNYGFYSNIASGTGRYNFYAAGSADNYFAGSVGIGSTNLTATSLRVGKNVTGGATAFAARFEGTVQSDVTSECPYISIAPSTAASAFTIPDLEAINIANVSLGAGSAVTRQYGIYIANLTSGTSNYGVFSNIAAGTNRYNFYAAGSADNYFAGALGIGTTPASTTSLHINKAITGGANAYCVYVGSTVDSSVATSTATCFQTAPNTSAGTTNSLTGYYSTQGTFTGTVNNQYGFQAFSALTGATNNYGFYSNIASGTGRYNFYAAGSANNFFGGNTGIGVTPNWALTVYDANNGFAQFVTSGTGSASTDGLLVGINASQQAVFRNRENTDSLFYTNDTERMRIDSSGNLISTAPTTAPTLSTNGTMVFNLTSNTNLRVSVRGSDGVTRTANITLA